MIISFISSPDSDGYNNHLIIENYKNEKLREYTKEISLTQMYTELIY